MRKRNIAIISAFKYEVRKILKSLSPEIVFQNKKQFLYKKEYDNFILYIGITGVGCKNVNKFFKRLKDTKIKFDFLISTGFAGAINKKLKTGDIIVAKKIIYEGFEYEIRKSPFQLSIEGIGISVNKIFRKEDKEKYLNIADFVDMESGEIVKIAFKDNIPVNVIKIISDDFDFKFPSEEFMKFIYKKLKIRDILYLFFRSPLTIYRIFRLKLNLYYSMCILNKFLNRLINEIILKGL